jgi:hypothetical protein
MEILSCTSLIRLLTGIRNTKQPIESKTGQNMINLFEHEVILLSGSAKTPSRLGYLKKMESGAVNPFVQTLLSKLP